MKRLRSKGFLLGLAGAAFAAAPAPGMHGSLPRAASRMNPAVPRRGAPTSTQPRSAAPGEP